MCRLNRYSLAKALLFICLLGFFPASHAADAPSMSATTEALYRQVEKAYLTNGDSAYNAAQQITHIKGMTKYFPDDKKQEYLKATLHDLNYPNDQQDLAYESFKKQSVPDFATSEDLFHSLAEYYAVSGNTPDEAATMANDMRLPLSGVSEAQKISYLRALLAYFKQTKLADDSGYAAEPQMPVANIANEQPSPENTNNSRDVDSNDSSYADLNKYAGIYGILIAKIATPIAAILLSKLYASYLKRRIKVVSNQNEIIDIKTNGIKVVNTRYLFFGEFFIILGAIFGFACFVIMLVVHTTMLDSLEFGFCIFAFFGLLGAVSYWVAYRIRSKDKRLFIRGDSFEISDRYQRIYYRFFFKDLRDVSCGFLPGYGTANTSIYPLVINVTFSFPCDPATKWWGISKKTSVSRAVKIVQEFEIPTPNVVEMIRQKLRK